MGKKNCIVGQSGGPTAVINSSLCGIIKQSKEIKEIGRIYGTKYGIEGILKNQIINLSSINKQEIELLKYTPSSILGSCRYKLKDYKEDNSDYIKIFEIFEKYNIGYFYYIGGNDSMDTVSKLSSYAESINSDIRIIGIPKTIDNDLPITDHCPGYASAAKYIATSIMEIARDGDVYDKENIHIIEVMGRHSGWLAAASSLASADITKAPDLLYLPEFVFDLDDFIINVKRLLKTKKRLNIVVAEGVKDSNGKYIYKTGSASHDEFGHKQMGGVGSFLGELLQEKLSTRVKVIELNVLQRSAAHFASRTDILEAYQCGKDAVKYSLDNSTGIMVGIRRLNSKPYKSRSFEIPVKEVANKEKTVPLDWIDVENKSMKQEFLEYLLPLIQGENELPIKNGLPKYAAF